MLIRKIIFKINFFIFLFSGLVFSGAQAIDQPAGQREMLIYCGITMVRPMTEISRLFEQKENIKIAIAQGGSEDLYQSAKTSGLGDLYLPGEPSYRDKHIAEGLLGDFVVVGYNQMALVVRKGNPKNIKGNPNELLRPDVSMMIGNAESGSVGQETKKILESMGLYQKVVDKAIALASDSRSLNAAMKKAEIDVIMNWRATGFFQDNAQVVDIVDLDPVLAKPQALMLTSLNFSKNQDLVRRFMQFSSSAEGKAIFRKHGFFSNEPTAQ
jgi:molybdate transport system substrate-binding protein